MPKIPGIWFISSAPTSEELGGSHYYDLFGAIGNNVPKVDGAQGLG